MQAFTLDDRLFVTAYTAAGRHAAVIAAPDGTTTEVAGAGAAVVRGPAESVLWMATRAGQATIVRRDADGTYQRYPVTLGDSTDGFTLAATQDAVFVSNAGRVTRYTVSGSALTDPYVVSGAKEAILDNPFGNDIVVTNGKRCTAVVSAADPTPASWACRYRVAAVSADGRSRYGYDSASEDGVVTDALGQPVMLLDNVGSTEAVFDGGGRLQPAAADLESNDTTIEVGLVVCDLPRRCRRVGDPSDLVINGGSPPIVLVQ